MGTTFTENKEAFGGTEYMARGFNNYVLPYVPKLNNYNCVLVPGRVPSIQLLLDSEKEIILWLHNTIEQFDDDKTKILKDNNFLSKIKYIIVPSNYHKSITVDSLGINEDKIFVIPNAIEPLKYNSNKFISPEKIKAINTADPSRGLNILLNSFFLFNKNIELNVFNSYNPDLDPSFNFKDNRVFLYGRTPKLTVRKHYEDSHIYAYPSIYLETFCISQIEAMSAGLLCVYPNIGSLPEVSGGYGIMYEYTDDPIKHIEMFASKLEEAISLIESNKFDPREQIEFVNSEYSWERHKERWLELHDKL